MLYTKNPKTGRNIKINGGVYKKLMRSGEYLLSVTNGNIVLLPTEPVYTPPPTVNHQISVLDNLMINRYIGDLGKPLY